MQAYLYTTEEQEVFDLAAPNALEAISNFDWGARDRNVGGTELFWDPTRAWLRSERGILTRTSPSNWDHDVSHTDRPWDPARAFLQGERSRSSRTNGHVSPLTLGYDAIDLGVAPPNDGCGARDLGVATPNDGWNARDLSVAAPNDRARGPVRRRELRPTINSMHWSRRCTAIDYTMELQKLTRRHGRWREETEAERRSATSSTSCSIWLSLVVHKTSHNDRSVAVPQQSALWVYDLQVRVVSGLAELGSPCA